jgi:hypothetical protein
MRAASTASSARFVEPDLGAASCKAATYLARQAYDRLNAF